MHRTTRRARGPRMPGTRFSLRRNTALFIAALMMTAAGGAVAATAPVHTRSVAYEDVRITYLDQGSGPAILMIPSLGRGAHDFDDLAGRVSAAGFRVIRIQPRGVDGSTGPMRGLTFHDLAADVAHVIRSAGVGRAVVLGHDDGNRIARATAAYYPDLVSAVILVGSGGKIPPDPLALHALEATFNADLSPEAHLQAVGTAFFAPGHDPSVWRDGWYAATAHMEHDAGTHTPTSDWWTAGSAPVLVIQGEQDRIAPPQNAAAIKAELGARAEVRYLDHAGHALLPERPNALARIVVDYLKHRR